MCLFDVERNKKSLPTAARTPLRTARLATALIDWLPLDMILFILQCVLLGFVNRPVFMLSGAVHRVEL
jgi:hypothetical protein